MFFIKDPWQSWTPGHDGAYAWTHPLPHDPQIPVRPPQLLLKKPHHTTGHLAVVLSLSLTPRCLCVVIIICRTGFFYHGRLDWDFYSQEGRYVRENCRPLLVSLLVSRVCSAERNALHGCGASPSACFSHVLPTSLALLSFKSRETSHLQNPKGRRMLAPRLV